MPNRQADPNTLDGDANMTGGAIKGPGLPRFDSDQSMAGGAVPDYTSKKADASKGGKSLQVETGTSDPGITRVHETGRSRSKS
ncbi:hypothetical protein ACFLXE_00205 [Chloroflexota bacterium]